MAFDERQALIEPVMGQDYMKRVYWIRAPVCDLSYMITCRVWLRALEVAGAPRSYCLALFKSSFIKLSQSVSGQSTLEKNSGQLLSI